MLRKRAGRGQALHRLGLAALAATLFLPLHGPRAQDAAAKPAEPTGTAAEASPTAPVDSGIRGKVVHGDGLPFRGAVVRASSLQTGEEIVSAPTGRKGEFELTGLPHGYWDLAVETDEGLFAGNRVINVPPSGFAVLQLRIGGTVADNDNSAYGSRADGRVTVERKLNKREFWRSPKGIGILAGIGGAGLLALAANDESDRIPASPL